MKTVTGSAFMLWVSILAGLTLLFTLPDTVLAREPAARKYYIILEGRLSYARGDETTYAELANVARGNVTLLDTYDVELDDGWSGKVGFGIQVNKRWDVVLSYSGLTVDGDDDTGSAVYYPVGVHQVLGGYPNPIYYATAEAEAETTYHVVDFEAGYNIALGGADLRLSAGVRYAEFDQEVDTFFSYPGYTSYDSREVDYWGIGPRIAVAASVPLGGSNFLITGKVGGAVLFGDNDSETTQVGTFIGSSKVSDSSSREVYNLDGELGLGYRINVNPGFQALVTVGYRAEAWYDINDTSSTATVTGNRYGSRHDDQIFHGPFLRTEFRF